MSAYKMLQAGVTLLEVMLVLVIGSAILLLGIQQYRIYQRSSDEQQVLANVEKLFQAAAYYYRSNCRNKATMAPNTSPSYMPPMTYQLDIPTELVTPKFLSDQAPKTNIILTTGGWDGYLVQFNGQAIISEMTVCANPPTCTTTKQAQIGTSILWTTQVAVLLNDPTLGDYYKNLLGAQCLSSLSGGTVAPCSAGSPGSYLVFEQMPSVTSNKVPQDLWLTNPNVELFTQSFTTNLVTNADHTTEWQYFVCGS